MLLFIVTVNTSRIKKDYCIEEEKKATYSKDLKEDYQRIKQQLTKQ